MSKPLVSVLIDTYNHDRFIEEAIVSVLEQDYPQSEMEVIVVDDGSTDRTPEIIRKFAPRVRHLRKTNGGQASAFNAGIPEAQGKFIAFLDGDDWWVKNKISRVAKVLAEKPEVGIVGHGIIIVHRDGRQQLEELREGFRFRADALEGVRLFSRRGSFLGTSRMTIRSALLQRIGLVPEAISVQADEYLFTLAAALSDVQILAEPLTCYRLHDTNAFLISRFEPSRIRHKQKSLALIAKSLSVQLEQHGIDRKARCAIVEIIQANADQLRLMVDGGWPWETVRTEWRMYKVAHPEAAVSHRAFKILTLLAALATPPRSFYSVQRRLAQSSSYGRLRQRWLPIPQMPHIHKDWQIHP